MGTVYKKIIKNSAWRPAFSTQFQQSSIIEVHPPWCQCLQCEDPVALSFLLAGLFFMNLRYSSHLQVSYQMVGLAKLGCNGLSSGSKHRIVR